MRLPIATFINMATVVVGSLLGLWLQQFFPENIQQIIFQAIGLSTLLIGIQMALKLPAGYLLILVFGMISGGVLGEWWQLSTLFQQTGDYLKESLAIGDERFTEGLVTAFLLFCVGSMTIVGAIEEGIHGKRELLLVKSTMDGIVSIAFASTYGIGVLFSIFPMLVLQGGITILAARVAAFFTPSLLGALTSAGGLLIIGVGINLLNLGKINLENLLPSILTVVLLSYIYEQFFPLKKA